MKCCGNCLWINRWHENGGTCTYDQNGRQQVLAGNAACRYWQPKDNTLPMKLDTLHKLLGDRARLASELRMVRRADHVNLITQYRDDGERYTEGFTVQAQSPVHFAILETLEALLHQVEGAIHEACPNIEFPEETE